MRRPLDVVAAVIRHEGRLLVCRRPEEKRHGGLFEFPGGKVDAGESFRDAVARELQEELGLELRGIDRTLFSNEDPGSRFVIHFIEAEVSGEPVLHEHTEVRWLRPDECSALPLAPSDRAFIQAYIETC